MSYFTPIYRVLYHIVMNMLALTSSHRMDMTYISLHLLYVIIRGIQINLGAFMLKYMLLCKDNST